MTDAATADPVANAWVQIFNAGGYVAGVRSDGLGRYKVSVPAGSYWARYVDTTRRLYPSWFGGSTDFASAVAIVVTTAPVTADASLGAWPVP